MKKFAVFASILLATAGCLELDDAGAMSHGQSGSATGASGGGGRENATSGGAGATGSTGGASGSSTTGASTGGGTGQGGIGGSGGRTGSGGSGGGTGSAGRAGAGGGSAVVCTAKTTWAGSNGEMMRPGEPCLSCHRSFYASGTVYPTLHEPNDCDGIDGNYEIAVVLTDANGQVVTRTVNSWGNFYVGEPVATPFHAKVVNMTTGQERAMTMAQTQRDCNTCHTQNGANNAPGRIMAP